MQEVIIYLGSKCNLNCPYCHRERNGNETGVSQKLLDYLKDRECLIIFKGGEPTLYMDDIDKVVKAANKARFRVNTNGKLLDKYIEYFREHNFQVCISYDGDNNVIRGYDPFIKYIDYPDLGISSTICHGNTDIESILDNFMQKSVILGRIISFYPHVVHYTNKANKQYALTKEDYESVLEQFKTCVTKYIDYAKKYHSVNMRYRGIYAMLRLRLEHHFVYGETYCAWHNSTRIDTKGTRYNCLYIRDTELDDNYLSEQTKLIDKQFPKCKTCLVYDMCGAGCVKSLGHEMECWFYSRLYSWFRQVYEENREVLDSLECTTNNPIC